MNSSAAGSKAGVKQGVETKEPLFKREQGPLAAAIGVVAGLLSGLMGIGGGTVAIPGMVIGLKIPQHRAHGTSLAMITLTAPISALAYAAQGNVDWRLALVITIGMCVGAYVGAKVMMHIPAKQLRRGFAVVLFATALKMLWG